MAAPDSQPEALARARRFAERAAQCPPDSADFADFVQAAVVFGRGVAHHLQHRYKHHRQWRTWWDALEANPVFRYFRGRGGSANHRTDLHALNAHLEQLERILDQAEWHFSFGTRAPSAGPRLMQ